MKLKVRGNGNSDARRLRDKIVSAIPVKERISGISIEQQDEITNRALIETVLLDWANIADDEGNPIPFDAELAASWIRDPDYENFRTAVMWAGNEVAEIGSENVEADSKN